jgi:broad specificity phosphatase PhoE
LTGGQPRIGQDRPVTVLLMRHGEPDWGQVKDPRWRGAANDWAPLTPHGQVQAEHAADRLAGQHPTLVLSSPMTRALQTAAIVASRLALPLAVELDLREWLPDETYQWTSAHEVASAYTDMLHRGGTRENHGSGRWEPLDQVRDRALAALHRHANPGATVVAVCHEVLIHAVTGHPQTGHGDIRTLSL